MQKQFKQFIKLNFRRCQNALFVCVADGDDVGIHTTSKLQHTNCMQRQRKKIKFNSK